MSIHPQLGRHGLFEARVPRYTSYPAATHFTDAVGPAQTRRWLAAVPAGARISLYVHVPFCRRLCWFCACRTQGSRTLSPLAAYVETLQAEIGLIAAALPEGVRLAHLHWGGGTPTLLPPALIRTLSGTIFGHLPLAEGARFSVEIDPNEIDPARLDALQEAGMNRASIGVQDFHPAIQAAIGRRVVSRLCRRAVAMLRERGISSLNMDILYGLPHQSPARIAETVGRVIGLGPDRVALYGYAHVPWMARRQVMIPADALPDPEARLGLFETARELFLAAGYRAIGIDHFARPDDALAVVQQTGRLRRNFQGYTEDDSEILIGLGASAISRYPQGHAQNAPATAAYQQAVRGGRLATCRGHAFAGEDRLRGRLIEMLLCDFAIDHARAAAETGTTPAAVRALTRPLRDGFGGLLEEEADRLSIRPEARPLARIIAHRLDAYAPAPGAHSSAI